MKSTSSFNTEPFFKIFSGWSGPNGLGWTRSFIVDQVSKLLLLMRFVCFYI